MYADDQERHQPPGDLAEDAGFGKILRGLHRMRSRYCGWPSAARAALRMLRSP